MTLAFIAAAEPAHKRRSSTDVGTKIVCAMLAVLLALSFAVADKNHADAKDAEPSTYLVGP